MDTAVKVTAYVVESDFVHLETGEHFYHISADYTQQDGASDYDVWYVVATRASAAARQVKQSIKARGGEWTRWHDFRQDDGAVCQHCGKVGGH